MRFFTAILISFFALAILDAQPLQPGINPKTCCGRQICSCTHQKGAFCPFKKREAVQLHHEETHRMPSNAGAGSHKICHLRSAKATLTASATSKTIRTKAPAATLREAPCHSKTSRQVLPGYAKDFYFQSDTVDGIRVDSQTYDPLSILNMTNSFARGIDHPPRNSSAFLLFHS